MFVGQNYNDNAIINTDEVSYCFILNDLQKYKNSKNFQF